MKLNWNFRRGGGGGSNQETICWGGLDIYWSNALCFNVLLNVCHFLLHFCSPNKGSIIFFSKNLKNAYSPYCSPYISNGTGKENLSKYQDISSLVITSFILIT